MGKTLVKIYPGGRMETEGQGFEGDLCLEELKRLLDSLKGLGVDSQVIQQELKESSPSQTETRSQYIQVRKS